LVSGRFALAAPAVAALGLVGAAPVEEAVGALASGAVAAAFGCEAAGASAVPFSGPEARVCGVVAPATSTMPPIAHTVHSNRLLTMTGLLEHRGAMRTGFRRERLEEKG
jgi:hypothetical protein